MTIDLTILDALILHLLMNFVALVHHEKIRDFPAAHAHDQRTYLMTLRGVRLTSQVEWRFRLAVLNYLEDKSVRKLVSRFKV
jgi:hypothetical protein